MSILDIIKKPSPILREICTPVTEFDAQLETLVQDMIDTMHANKGIGLAASQIGVLSRLFICSYQKESLICINPELTLLGSVFDSEESCLSIPGVSAIVERHETVSLKAFNTKGQPFKLSLSGMIAIIVQHEYDHLNGKLITDENRRLKELNHVN